MPYALDGDSGPAPHIALSALAGASDVQLKNRISGLLLETGVSHNKQRLHKVKYFRELMENNKEVEESIRPLLKLSRESIVRLQKTEYALISSLERDPLLRERLRNLRTVPGVGPITALTWALEIAM